MSHIQTFAPKDIIFRENEVGNAAYIIHGGQIEILKSAEHGEIQLAVLERGDVFGEMALFESHLPRSASARALAVAKLEVITAEHFAQMMQSVPVAVTVMVQALTKRLRETNQRLAQKERASVVLDGAIEKITIRPATESLSFEPIELMAANLPFSIGGYPKSEARPNNNNLDLPCDGPPLMISQKHLQLERKDGDLFAVDQGARFCTIVNGKVIGRGKVDVRAQLQLGENKVTLGDFTSPYKLLLDCA
jgi:CRP-like cAMP-binding protein